MPHKLTFLLLYLPVNFIFGQDLYVGNNSYLYAKNVVVFVNNDIRLEAASSNFYLRGNAQLVQNTDTKNSDIGELSIYQNQTTGIYEYNYWCSPVGVGIDGALKANRAFNGSNIRDPQNDLDLTNVTSSPYLFTAAYNGTATELSKYWIYTFISGEGYYSWKHVYNTGNIPTGYGFTLKGSPNANNVLDFRGRPNNGTISVDCSFDGVDNQPTSGAPGYAATLTGNPYPSALDLKLFFANSANNQADLSGEIFFWEQKAKNSHNLADYEGGYGVYIPGDLIPPFSDNGTYTAAPFENYNGDGSTIGNTTGSTTDFSPNNNRRYAAVGQGFMIMSNVNGGNAIFDNSMRVYFPEDSTPLGSGSIFAKNGSSKTNYTAKEMVIMSHNGIDYKAIIENPTVIPEIRLHTHINNTYYKENVIAFREGTPDNYTYNKFFDGRNTTELSADAYLISADKELVIKSIKYDETVRLKLGLKASKGNTLFSIKINKLNNVPNDVNVYVFDKDKNTYTDIKNGVFNITLNKGLHNDRFQITFANNSLGIEDTAFNEFKIVQNNTISQLKLFNPTNLSVKTISVFDVSGKKVFTEAINSAKNEYQYSTKSLSDGVYIVKIESTNRLILNKKIVVSNTAN